MEFATRPPPSHMSQGPPQVPEGWAARFNEQYQTWFYVNTHTEQSQWEPPTSPVFAAPAPTSNNNNNHGREPTVPAGWAARFSDQYGIWFYVNTYTKQSQWEPPSHPVFPPHSADVNKDPYAPVAAPMIYHPSDEDLARRLQAEEEEAARQESQRPAAAVGVDTGSYAAPPYSPQPNAGGSPQFGGGDPYAHGASPMPVNENNYSLHTGGGGGLSPYPQSQGHYAHSSDGFGGQSPGKHSDSRFGKYAAMAGGLATAAGLKTSSSSCSAPNSRPSSSGGYHSSSNSYGYNSYSTNGGNLAPPGASDGSYGKYNKWGMPVAAGAGAGAGAAGAYGLSKHKKKLSDTLLGTGDGSMGLSESLGLSDGKKDKKDKKDKDEKDSKTSKYGKKAGKKMMKQFGKSSGEGDEDDGGDDGGGDDGGDDDGEGLSEIFSALLG